MTALRIASISGSLQEPSKTDALIDAVTAAVVKRIPGAEVETVQVSRLTEELTGVVFRPQAGPALEAKLQAVENADLLVVGAPVYKGSYTGLFKHLIDLLGHETLVDVPVILTATGGSDRHALVIDHQFRPLFSFFRALALPIGLYGSSTDFDGYTVASSELLERIDAAADQAVTALRPRIAVAP